MYTTKELKKQIENKLIRKDGKLNSPFLQNPEAKKLIERAREATNDFLDEHATFSQVWWHIKNNILEIPKCVECQKLLPWNGNGKYLRFCTQVCASTSKEASLRTSKQFVGGKHSKKHILASIEGRKLSTKKRGYYHSKETKEKLSEAKLGKKNPMFGKVAWNRGLLGIAYPLFGVKRPGSGMKGKDNPQYGKSPSPFAGRGISGHFNGKYFRSSLELLYLIYWYVNDVEIITAETKRFRVEYIGTDENKHTYTPDFYLCEQNILVELKPEKLQTNKEVIIKFSALKKHHPDIECEMRGFKEIDIFIRNIIENDQIEDYKQSGLLKLTDKQYERLKRNYGDIIRATF